MPTIVTGDHLREAVKNQTFLKGGDPNCAEGVKYDFRLSSRILKASLGRPVDASQLAESEKLNLFVEPGEMVFVLSEERLALPEDMMAELSPKRKLSHAGVLAIGGFCIDPKYKGRLLIGLYNLSSTRFPLRPGKKVIAAIFYKLDEVERGDFPEPDLEVDDFPDELVTVMEKYRPLAVQSVADSLEKLRADLDALRQQISSHDEWYRRFEQSLERHDKQIGDLLQGLSAEKEARASGEDRIGLGLQKIEKTLAWLKGAAWVVGVLLASIAIPLLVAWLTKFWHLS